MSSTTGKGKAIFRVVSGNFLEMFDFMVYGFYATAIAKTFFPTDSAFASADVWSSFWETDLSQSVLLSRDNAALERELMAWLDFWSPGNHDDRTIAIMLP